MKIFSSILFAFFLLYSCGGTKKITVNKASEILFNKYAIVLGVSKSKITNIRLYSFIDDWSGTKYKYGGMSKSGVDCSGFCNVLYNDIYSKSLKRRVSDIVKDINKVSKNNLKEGDLVFFNISKKKNAHVGIYLTNNKFVHASTSKGVIISSLDNPYYKKAYNKGGHL